MRFHLSTVAILFLSLFGSVPCIAQNIAEIYQLAKSADAVFQAAQFEMLASIEARPQAQALLLPALSISASKSHNKASSDRAFFATNAVLSTENYALRITQPLLNMGRWASLRQADKAVLQAQSTLDEARQQLILRTASQYFGVLAALDTLEFATAEIQAIQRQLDQAKQRFDVGLIAITDVHEAQAAFDLATADEISAKNGVDVAREALRAVTGQYHFGLAVLADNTPLPTPDPADIDIWTTAALKNNALLVALQYQVEASRENIRSQKSGHLPTLDLVGTHSYSNTSGSAFGDGISTDNIIEVQLNWSLFEGGAVVSKTKQAQHQYQQLQSLLEDQQRVTQRDAREAYLGVISGISRVKALAQAVTSTESALRATESGFEVGTRTTVDVLDAQRDLFRARRNYSQSRYDFTLATLKLRSAAGSLTDEHIETIATWLKPASSNQ